MDLTHIFYVLLLGFKSLKSVRWLMKYFEVLFQGPPQAQNLRDSLVEAMSDIIVKVSD